MNEPQGNYAKSNKPVTEGLLLHNTTFISYIK